MGYDGILWVGIWVRIRDMMIFLRLSFCFTLYQVRMFFFFFCLWGYITLIDAGRGGSAFYLLDLTVEFYIWIYFVHLPLVDI